MGAPTLKKKKQLNYRRGYQSENCGYCTSFVGHYGEDGNLDEDNRCEVIGLEGGRAFRICRNNICDAFELRGL